ncbi:MAG TPA: hypothetical protein VK752_24585 [Bryobacteraceae bacterium]|jgi:hypothetical protein|nr:hypothetical protein [Bryobacteraceae bacterium]
MEIRRCLLLIPAALLSGCASAPVQQKTSVPDPVKILAFYPRDAVVTEGEKTLLCYGVSNAASVRVDPPVDGVSPSLTRCVEIRPKAETRYTLTAVGADGQSVSQSVTVRIGTDTASLPKITSFKIEGTSKDYAGNTIYTLSFADQNAEEVSISPQVFPTLHGAPSGQFSVKPEKTTTYTLSVKGKNGRVAQKQLTVEVKAP